MNGAGDHHNMEADAVPQAAPAVDDSQTDAALAVPTDDVAKNTIQQISFHIDGDLLIRVYSTEGFVL